MPIKYERMNPESLATIKRGGHVTMAQVVTVEGARKYIYLSGQVSRDADGKPAYERCWNQPPVRLQSQESQAVADHTARRCHPSVRPGGVVENRETDGYEPGQEHIQENVKMIRLNILCQRKFLKRQLDA